MTVLHISSAPIKSQVRPAASFPTIIYPEFNPDAKKYRNCWNKVHSFFLLWHVGPLELIWLVMDLIMVMGFVRFQPDLIDIFILVPWIVLIVMAILINFSLFHGLRKKSPIWVVPHMVFQFVLIPILLSCGAAVVCMLIPSQQTLDQEIFVPSRVKPSENGGTDVFIMGVILATSLLLQGVMELYFLRISINCFRFFYDSCSYAEAQTLGGIIVGGNPPTPTYHKGTPVQPKMRKILGPEDYVDGKIGAFNLSVSPSGMENIPITPLDHQSRYQSDGKLETTPKISKSRGNQEESGPYRPRKETM